MNAFMGLYYEHFAIGDQIWRLDVNIILPIELDIRRLDRILERTFWSLMYAFMGLDYEHFAIGDQIWSLDVNISLPIKFDISDIRRLD